MANNEYGINSLADQRYFNFVAVKDSRGFSLPRYWRSFGEIARPSRALACNSSFYTIEHRKLRSDKAYARGNVAQELSERGNGRPPFLYDLVAIETEIHDSSYFLLGFPFIGLAADIVRDHLARKLFQLGDLQRVNVPVLLQIMDSDEHRAFEQLAGRMVAVHFIVTDDTSVTNVRLGGDQPLKGEIYTTFLKKRVAAGFVAAAECVLACQREVSHGSKEVKETPRLIRSRLHLDKHGNFRFYAHVGCTNLALLPEAMSELDSLGCLHKATANPLDRVNDDSFE
jgi:hypothetical protein